MAFTENEVNFLTTLRDQGVDKKTALARLSVARQSLTAQQPAVPQQPTVPQQPQQDSSLFGKIREVTGNIREGIKENAPFLKPAIEAGEAAARGIKKDVIGTEMAAIEGKITPGEKRLENVVEGVSKVILPTAKAGEKLSEPVFEAIGSGLKAVADFATQLSVPNTRRLIGEENIKAINDTINKKLNEAITDPRVQTIINDPEVKRVAPVVGKGLESALALTQVKPSIEGIKKSAELFEKGVVKTGKFTGKILEKRRLASIQNIKTELEAVKNIEEARSLAKEYGVELPASSLTNSNFRSKTEQILAEGVFGGSLKDRGIKAMKDSGEAFNKVANKAPTSTVLGKNASTKLESVIKEEEDTIKAIYNKAQQEIAGGKDIPLNLTETNKILDKQIKQRSTADISNKGLPLLKKIRKRMKEISTKKLTEEEFNKQFIKDFTKNADNTKKALNKLSNPFFNDIKNSFNSSIAAIKKNDFKNTDLIKTKALVQKKINDLSSFDAEGTDSNVLKNIKNNLDELTKKPAFSNIKNIEAAQEILKELGDNANFNSFNPTTEEKLFRSLRGKFKKDIDQSILENGSQSLQNELNNAKSKFQSLKKLEKRSFVKNIKNLADLRNFDTISNIITNTAASIEEINQIYGTLGKDITKNIQEKIIANIIKNAKSTKGDFLEGGFSKQLMKLGDEKMRALFTTEQIKQLNDFNKLNKLIATSQKVAKGSQTGKLIQIMSAASAIGTAITTGSVVPALGVAAAGFLSNFIASKAGQQMLKGNSAKQVKKLKDIIKKLNQPGLIEKTIK